jgi:thioredoxin-like negative regulator of GroEL
MKPIDNINKRDKIATALNKNLPVAAQESQPVVDHLQDDYEESRETYKELIDKGNEAIDLMMELARDSQHPRAFEVLATLLKTQSDNNDKLIDLQKKLKTLKEPTKGAQATNPNSVTNNNVFVGSTSDLQRFILQQNKSQVIDVDTNLDKE